MRYTQKDFVLKGFLLALILVLTSCSTLTETRNQPQPKIKTFNDAIAVAIAKARSITQAINSAYVAGSITRAQYNEVKAELDRAYATLQKAHQQNVALNIVAADLELANAEATINALIVLLETTHNVSVEVRNAQ